MHFSLKKTLSKTIISDVIRRGNHQNIKKWQCHHAIQKLSLFGILKLALALQFIVTNAYFSVARTLTLVLNATLK